MHNQKTHISSSGINKILTREHLANHYYNDAANDCTYGIGTFVHFGPCTKNEEKKVVTNDNAYNQFSARVNDAERTVRRFVKNTHLSQEQFDALVSYTYNRGATVAKHTLETANRGDFPKVIDQMKRTVYLHKTDAQGRKLLPTISMGLVNRRREEAKPFEVKK